MSGYLALHWCWFTLALVTPDMTDYVEFNVPKIKVYLFRFMINCARHNEEDPCFVFVVKVMSRCSAEH